MPFTLHLLQYSHQFTLKLKQSNFCYSYDTGTVKEFTFNYNYRPWIKLHVISLVRDDPG